MGPFNEGTDILLICESGGGKPIPQVWSQAKFAMVLWLEKLCCNFVDNDKSRNELYCWYCWLWGLWGLGLLSFKLGATDIKCNLHWHWYLQTTLGLLLNVDKISWGWGCHWYQVQDKTQFTLWTSWEISLGLSLMLVLVINRAVGDDGRVAMVTSAC